MRHQLLRIIQTLAITMSIVLFGVLGIGYTKYEQVTEDFSVAQRIDEVMQHPEYVESGEINQTFLDAVVAIEDHRFYDHGPVDMIAIVRAVVKNITAGEVVQGGSTITQQLAKNLFLSSDQTFMRKLEELFFAYELEKVLAKDEILELYVNVIYYGDGHTGIAEASEGYFGKEPNELSYEEATLLAGLPQAPSRYALSSHYERAVKRQAQVVAALDSYYE